MDSQGRRWGDPGWSIDLGIHSQFEHVSSLYPSPDMRSLIVGVALDIDTTWLWVDLSTRERHGIIGHRVAETGGFLAWSPTGREVVFQSGISQGEVWLLDLVSGSYQVLDFPVSEWSGESLVYDAAFSPDGRWLADASMYHGTSETDPEIEIGVQTLGQGERTSLVRIPGYTAIQGSLDWSPDGSTLVCAILTVGRDRNPSDTAAQLWTIDALDGTATLLTQEVAFPRSRNCPRSTPVWSPDGSVIAFLKTDAGSEEENPPFTNIYLLDTETAAEQQVTAFSERSICRLAWSPDGSMLAFTLSLGEYSEIWVTEFGTGQAFPVAGPAAWNAPFVWLPVVEGGE